MTEYRPKTFRIRRQLAKVSLAEVARAAGVHVNTVDRYEHLRGALKEDTVERLHIALDKVIRSKENALKKCKKMKGE